MKSEIFVLIGFLCVLSLENVRATPKFTENEKLSLQKFRPMVAKFLYMDYMKQDNYLIRWLRAKDLDLHEATEMLKKNVRWRYENRIDNILQEDILKLSRPALYTNGIDNTGSPVCTFLPSRLDMRRFMMTGKRNETIRFFDQVLEYAEVGIRSLAVNNSDITEGTFIWDLLGYDIARHGCLPCITTYFDWIKQREAYYPGLCKELIFINTPNIFTPLLDMLKSIMSKETRKVVKVFGTNKEEWMSYLQKFISPNQLIEQLGGNLPE